MGLDGMDSTEAASSAHVAKSLDVPVILVLNVHGCHVVLQLIKVILSSIQMNAGVI